MALAGFAPLAMKTTALALNLPVATIATFAFLRAGRLSWRDVWPFAILGFPFSLLGGAIQLPEGVYYPVVGAVLVFSPGARAMAGKELTGSSRGAVATGAAATGAASLGAMALGAVALGALAVGALAVGRLTVGRARLRRVEIGELRVGRLEHRRRGCRRRADRARAGPRRAGKGRRAGTAPAGPGRSRTGQPARPCAALAGRPRPLPVACLLRGRGGVRPRGGGAAPARRCSDGRRRRGWSKPPRTLRSRSSSTRAI